MATKTTSFNLFDTESTYNNSVDKFGSLIFLIVTAAKVTLNYIINVGLVLAEILIQVLFGWVRGVLIAGFLFSLLSVAILENHKAVFEASNSAKCAYSPFFNTLESATGILAENTPPIICFWNFGISFNNILLRVALNFFWLCSDLSNVFKDFITVLAKIAESLATFLLKPGSTSILSNKFDFESIVTAIQDLISNLKDPLKCACSDFAFFSDYVLSVVTNENIPALVQNFGTAVISLMQVGLQTFLNMFTGDRSIVPVVESINYVCYGSISTGLLIDDTVTDFVKIFWPTFDPTRIGSVLAYTVCILTDLAFLFTDSSLQYIWRAAFSSPGYNVFLDANLVPLIEHLNSLGLALQASLSPLNVCLGQTIGNAVRFLSALLGYIKGIVQDNENNLSSVRTALNRFVGQSSYGGGGHILNTNGHSNARQQTSLTCLLASSLNFSALGYTTCSVKLADFANSIVQLVLTPLTLLSEVLDNKELLTSIDGNPLAANSREDFETFFAIVIDSVLDQVFNPFDYLAHLVDCIPILSTLSAVLVQVVYNLRNIARDLRTVIIKLIELLIQVIVLIISLLSDSVFPNSSQAEEFGIFTSLLLDLFVVLFKLVLEFGKNFISLTIGAAFPELFNQPGLYADSHTDLSSPATLPECFSSFGDCVCGIFYVNIGQKICIPFTDVCIGDILPSCGLFQTTPTWDEERRRFQGQLPYSTWFEYLADEFPNGTCGEVFKTFREYGKDGKGYLRETGVYSTYSNTSTLFYESSVPSLQGTAFITCLTRLMKSFELSEKHNWTLPYDYYIQDSRFVDSSSEIVRGTGMLFFDAVVQSATMLSYPEYISGLPTPDIPIFENTKESTYEDNQEWLSSNGVTDPLALDYLSRGTTVVSSALRKSKSLFYANSRQIKVENRNPYVRLLELGRDITGATVGGGLMILREIFTSETVPMMTEASVGLMRDIPALKLNDIFPAVQQTSHLKRRDHSAQLGGNYFPSVIPTLEMNERDDLVIEDSARAMFKLRNLATGSLAIGRKIAGPYLELLARRNMNYEQFGEAVPLRIKKPRVDRKRFRYESEEDVLSDTGFYHYSQYKKRNLMPHIYALNISLPDSLMANEAQNFHPDISYLYGMGGMVDFQHHIPYSCTRIHSYCDTNTLVGCDEDLYFQTLGLCNAFVGNFGIVTQCGEDFQAIAVYLTDSCTGNPVRIAIATPSNPISCVRFSINPTGPENDYFCIEYNQCQACPVRKVIPNLNCDYLDEIFHRDVYMIERCWAKLVGPIYPPFNFTDIPPSVTEPLIVDPVGNYVPVPTPTPAPFSNCSSVCGDRIKSKELDFDGTPCEECDDGNRRDGDGCSSNCKREKCPRWRVPFLFPIAPGEETPATCTTGTIPFIQSRRSSRYCHKRTIISTPSYTGSTLPGDVALDSFQISCIGNRPTITEYDTTDCTGYSTTRVVRNNCSNESPYTVHFVSKTANSVTNLDTALAIRVGNDITCKSKCGVCGDGVVQGPEQCDLDPMSSDSCTFCIKTEVQCSNLDLCQGICRPNLGEIAVDSRYGVQAPALCFRSLGSDIATCPLEYTCKWFTANSIVRKRDIVESGNFSRLLEVFSRVNDFMEDQDGTRKRQMETTVESAFGKINASAFHTIDPMIVTGSAQLINFASSPVKDNFMHNFAKHVVDDVITLFFSGSSGSYISNIVAWFQRDGVGPDTPPNEQGPAYELAFPFICDVIKSFDGSLGYGLIRGTVLWLAISLVLVVIAALGGALSGSIGVTLFMLLSATLYLRLTFGTALVGCYITASQYYFRLPENVFVEIHEVAVLLNGTCIDFLQPLASSPCNREFCNQTFTDCADLNYVDGFDTFWAIIEVWLPVEVSVWARTSTTAARLETMLKRLSSASGYDLYGSYTVAKNNFNFNGVLPHEGHKICSVITGFSLWQISLLLLVSIYAVYQLTKVTIPFLFDLGFLLFAAFNAFNHIILIPIQSGMRDIRTARRLELIRQQSKTVSMKIM